MLITHCIQGRSQPSSWGGARKIFYPQKGVIWYCAPSVPPLRGGTSPILGENKQKKTGFARLGGGARAPSAPPPWLRAWYIQY